jgi:hypothetical protein
LNNSTPATKFLAEKWLTDKLKANINR